MATAWDISSLLSFRSDRALSMSIFRRSVWSGSACGPESTSSILPINSDIRTISASARSFRRVLSQSSFSVISKIRFWRPFICSHPTKAAKARAARNPWITVLDNQKKTFAENVRETVVFKRIISANPTGVAHHGHHQGIFDSNRTIAPPPPFKVPCSFILRYARQNREIGDIVYSLCGKLRMSPLPAFWGFSRLLCFLCVWVGPAMRNA